MSIRNFFLSETLIYDVCEKVIVKNEPIDTFLVEFFQACFLCVDEDRTAMNILHTLLKKCEAGLCYIRKLYLRSLFYFYGPYCIERRSVCKNADLALRFIYWQLDDPDFMASLLTATFVCCKVHGLCSLLSTDGLISREGICMLKRSVGKRTFSAIGYFMRVATLKRMRFDNDRLDRFLPKLLRLDTTGAFYFHCREVFHFQPRIFLEYHNTSHRRIRPLTYTIFLLLPYIVRNFSWYQLDDQNYDVIEDEILGLQSLYKEVLNGIQFLFRTIPEPYVSLLEIVNVAELYSVSPKACFTGCRLYMQLLPEIFRDLYPTPRSLLHLCRCQIRLNIFNAWQLPEAVYQLQIPYTLIPYVGLYHQRSEKPNKELLNRLKVILRLNDI